ncbi:metal-dependent hydrolase family protein [Salmonirosea aquatica]|uniref:Amidohydrolase family protein n=1 Tax=Salmonirosea aquatica TaxID=2654236 RepID=A0A7C9BL73_9BACT|nr:amidohydrolase family protein [Cytophagaceae bacterium SJW1-29]
MIARFCFWLAAGLLTFTSLHAQSSYLLRPDRVFDGESMHENWSVWVKGERIVAVGNATDFPAEVSQAEVVVLAGMTLLPGLIEGHSHLFLHPYNETPWDDQVLKESRAYRTARAVKHAELTLLAGFTTVRDLGTEGAEYDDVGLKKAINEGIIPGPRMIVATRALVATGSYGPTGFGADVAVPQGAEEADGHDGLIRAVRTQIGKGADLIKIYADYRWGPSGETRPTYSEDEIRLIVETARSSGRPVVAHASTAEGMRRAIQAGVETIEHGNGGTLEIWKLMKDKNVALCPTLAAGDAISQYRGWKKGQDPEPERITQKKNNFKQALSAGVTMVMGGDVGVYAHGTNAREMELMVEYGMKPLDVLKAATSGNARIFHQEQQIGSVKSGLLADLVAVRGNPAAVIQDLQKVAWVMKGGKIYKTP